MQRQIWPSALLSKTHCLSTETTLFSPSSTKGKRAHWHAETNMVICSLSSKTQCLSTETIKVSHSSSRDSQVQWHVETIMVIRFRCFETILVPFTIKRQASPMVCRDDDGHLFFIVFEAIAVSLYHPETIESDGKWRPLWSFAFIVFKTIVVSVAIQRQSSPMVCGDHHGHPFSLLSSPQGFCWYTWCLSCSFFWPVSLIELVIGRVERSLEQN